MIPEHYDGWNSDSKDYLRLGGQWSYNLGLVLAGSTTGYLFGWQYTTFIYSVVIILALFIFAAVLFFYREWYEPGVSLPLWFYRSRNAAFVSACWPGLIVGLVTALTLGYLNQTFKPGLTIRLCAGAAIVMTLFWLCGKLALVSAKYNVDHGARLKTWIS